MDMGRRLDLESDSIVPLKYGPCRETTEPAASQYNLDWHIV